MRIIKISKQNEEQLYKVFVKDAERKDHNKLFSVTMWVLFALSAIAFCYGIVKILFGGYLLIEHYAPELVAGLLSMTMPLLFPLIVAACIYSIYDMLYLSGESWGNKCGRRIMIKNLVDNQFTDYISYIKDDGKIASEKKPLKQEELKEMLIKGGVMHEERRNN